MGGCGFCLLVEAELFFENKVVVVIEGEVDEKFDGFANSGVRDAVNERSFGAVLDEGNVLSQEVPDFRLELQREHLDSEILDHRDEAESGLFKTVCLSLVKLFLSNDLNR